MALMFISNLREIYGGRFDPGYVWFLRRQANFHYPAKSLGSLLSAPPEYGAAESGVERENDSQIRYVRITDIDENGELIPTLGATIENVEPQYLLKDGDLLFARSGSVGKCYLHGRMEIDYPCVYAGYLIRFRFSDDIIPDYVFTFAHLPYFSEWISAVCRTAVQPNINAQEYSNLKIPLPPLPVQRKIVAELDAAYAVKHEADRDATALLASIDDMVLDELGIAKLPPRDTSLAARVFIVPLKEVVGDRLDSYYYQPHFRELTRMIWKDQRTCRLGSIGDFVRGVVYSSKDEADEGHSILRANNISLEEMELDLSDLVHVGDTVEFNPQQKIHKGDVLICAASGSKEHAGKVAYVSKDILDTYIGGFMTVLRVGVDVSAEYVATYMQSSLFRNLIYRYLGGTNINNISLELLNKLPLILPDSSVQERIVRRAREIKAKAKHLKSTAAAQLAATKKRIEAELMGN